MKTAALMRSDYAFLKMRGNNRYWRAKRVKNQIRLEDALDRSRFALSLAINRENKEMSKKFINTDQHKIDSPDSSARLTISPSPCFTYMRDLYKKFYLTHTDFNNIRILQHSE